MRIGHRCRKVLSGRHIREPDQAISASGRQELQVGAASYVSPARTSTHEYVYVEFMNRGLVHWPLCHAGENIDRKLTVNGYLSQEDGEKRNERSVSIGYIHL